MQCFRVLQRNRTTRERREIYYIYLFMYKFITNVYIKRAEEISFKELAHECQGWQV